MKIDNEKFCVECGKDFGPVDYRRKFCSHNCSAVYSNKRRVRIQYVVADKYCAACHKQLLRYQRKYCGSVCAGLHRHDKTIQKMLSGKKVGGNVIKRYLKSTRSHQCVICKKKTWMGNPIPLTMDHIDGNPTNNILDNIR